MSVLSKPYAERDGSVFAEYPGLTIEYRDASHRYWLHADGERNAAVSVTSAIKVLDKPALLPWAEACGAEGAARLAALGELGDIPEDAIDLVRLHGLGMEAKRTAGADRGTATHRVLELWATEGKTPQLADFDPSVRGYVQGLSRFLLIANPKPLMTEVLVGSAVHGYAGRLDMIAMLDGRRTLIDLKTSPKARVYAEAHCQARGYCLALPECGIEPVERALIVAVSEDGQFTTAECVAEDEDWLAVLGCYRTMARLKAAVSTQEKVDKAVAQAAERMAS